MVKINFQNNITKANADTFNTMQDNIEDAIDEAQLDIYSTNETRIGTWIDGKPIYRKVITGEYALSAGENYIPHNISNFKECINAIAFDASATRLPSLGNATSLTYGSNIRAVNSTYIQIRSINDTWASRVWYFILEYTKTTD